MNVVRKRCGTCNSLRDCCCKGRVREVVLVKSSWVPEHQQTLSAEGRRAQQRREQAAKQHGALSQVPVERPNARSGAHWPAEHVHAQPPPAALRKEEVNGLRHLTAEGRRAAQMRLPKTEQQSLRAQGSGPRRSDRPAPAEHESVRLRHEQQHRQQSDAESKLAEGRVRQEKFAAEQHQVNRLHCLAGLVRRSSCSSPCLLPSSPVSTLSSYSTPLTRSKRSSNRRCSLRSPPIRTRTPRMPPSRAYSPPSNPEQPSTICSARAMDTKSRPSHRRE